MSETANTTLAYAESTYKPRPRRDREGVALALSGGGYRAALFHLGAIRRLNELGALSRVTVISSVSGGSIMAAFLASQLTPWPQPGARFQTFDSSVARPLKKLASTNIRTWPVAKRLLPWNWLKSQTQVETLAAKYRGAITRMNLRDLPAQPEFIICATDLSYAVNWEFSRSSMGDYQAGYLEPPADWPLARAVAASSCFPPIFQPLKVGLDPNDLTGGNARRGPDRDAIIRGLSLSDGGVYDNMALEPVWKSAETLLVSDGGAPFDVGPDNGMLWQLQRYPSVLGNQASAIRKRWLIAGFIDNEMEGAYWGIGSAASHYGFEGGYSAGLVKELVSEVRTDLDAFSDAEQAVLENHGYVMAEAAVRKHAAHLIAEDALPFVVPYPSWMDPTLVRDALKDSMKRTFWGRR